MQQADAGLAKPGIQKAAANLGWLLAERGVRFGLSVVVGFVVARYLGPARLGTLSYCTALVGLFTGFVGLGLDAVVKRDVLIAPQEQAAILASSAILRLVAAVVGYGILTVVAALGAARTREEQMLVAIVGATLFQPAFVVPDLWLQAQLRAKYSVIIQTTGLAIGAGCRIALVLARAPLLAFGVVVVVETCVVAALFQVSAGRAGLRFGWSAARRATMHRLLREAWPLMFASLAIVVYMETDEVMLRQLAGPAAVGVYAAATRLTEIWYFVPIALASSLLPALLRAREAGAAAYTRRLQHYYDVNAALAYAVSVPVALAAPWIIRLAYGPAFAASAPIVAVHVWSSIFVFLGTARGQWLVNERLQHFYLAATVAGAVLNVALNFVFIPHWGAVGAAVATVISQAVATWLSSFCSRATRPTAWMQTRALLLPVFGWRYLVRA